VDLDLEVLQGSHLALMGPSGSGKTTLLSVLGGIERPQSGRVIVGGRDLANCSGPDLAEFRRETVGFVFQHFGLLETATALENVELALALSGLGRSERKRRAAELLTRVGLGDRLSHRPAELSGGERQRVGMARAVANEPRVILADEPTGNLDGETAKKVVELLEELRRDRGATLVVATHDPALASRAERIVALSDGRAVDAVPRIGP
jgi:ABC-type lipoprotein export system ATPase subunit